MKRKGMGKGQGKGYKNIIGNDKKVHSDSAKGRKQPQTFNDIHIHKKKVNKSNFTPIDFTLYDLSSITLDKGNFSNYGVFSNISKYDSKEFETLEEAKKYFEEIKDSDLKDEYRSLLDDDINDYKIGIENITRKKRMNYIEKYFKDKER